MNLRALKARHDGRQLVSTRLEEGTRLALDPRCRLPWDLDVVGHALVLDLEQPLHRDGHAGRRRTAVSSD